MTLQEIVSRPLQHGSLAEFFVIRAGENNHSSGGGSRQHRVECVKTTAIGQKEIEKNRPHALSGQSFEAAGEGPNTFKIVPTVTRGDHRFFESLGVTGIIVDEKNLIVRVAHCKRSFPRLDCKKSRVKSVLFYTLLDYVPYR